MTASNLPKTKSHLNPCEIDLRKVEARDIDLRGLTCPMPVLHTQKTLRQCASGTRLRIICTDPEAALDIPVFLRQSGDVLEAKHHHGDEIIFIIRKA